MANKEKIAEFEARFPGGMDAVKKIIDLIGDNSAREGVLDTPFRVVKSWTELFEGYSQKPEDILGTTFEDGIGDTSEIVMCKDIPFFSTCEHHMLPFAGIAHIGYLPNKKVVGLSKLARLVDCYGRRLQIQEKMTNEIANSLMSYLDCQGCGVIIEASHMCMTCRGIKKVGSTMVTSAMRGKFKDQIQTRNEFLMLVKG